MIKLQEPQKDGLREICNIGMSRAAKQLAAIVNEEIEIDIPDIDLINAKNIINNIPWDSDTQTTCVYQEINGMIDGRALLIFPSHDSEMLIGELFVGNQTISNMELQQFESEAILEIGNIIISASISTIADMLGSEIMLTVPNYARDSLNNLLLKKEINQSTSNTDSGILAITTKLHAKERNLHGVLLLVFALESIELMLERLNKLTTPKA
ncbi:MAG: hypothetical protein K0U12_03690 [Gammaproteobacteria bacterium]|nr:hypothetical protein [Gammaproteobacteria bacterium]